MKEQTQMAERPQGKTGEMIEIDLGRIWRALWKRLWILMLCAVVGGVVSFLGTYLLVTPQYEAKVMFYVNNNPSSMEGSSLGISSGDISTSKSLVDSYIAILKSRTSVLAVIDRAGIHRSCGEVGNMISAASVNGTEVFEVTVTSTDPQEAAAVANAIAYVIPGRIGAIIEGSSVTVVDYAEVPAAPSAPNYTNNTMVGVVLALILSAAVIVLVEVFDVTIKQDWDVGQCCAYPILAEIPRMTAGGKAPKGAAGTDEIAQAILGSNISPRAAEAYKLLRTKLLFSDAGEKKGRILGISSAMAGEGKSVSAINLACSMARLDRKILLIDCDMHHPTLDKKLGCRRCPGLADYLTDGAGLKEVLRQADLGGEKNGFDVMAAGTDPHSAIELLSSPKMENLLETLRESYDDILLDLPAVGEACDAMVVSKLVDGILLVVRRDYCTRPALTDAVRQLGFIRANVLGLLVNCATDAPGGYGKHAFCGKLGRCRKFHP